MISDRELASPTRRCEGSYGKPCFFSIYGSDSVTHSVILYGKDMYDLPVLHFKLHSEYIKNLYYHKTFKCAVI